MSLTGALIVTPMDVVFSPIFALPPMLSIIIFSIILSVVTIALNRVLMKKEVMKEMKAKMKELQNTMKTAQKEGNKELVSTSMKEMMTINGKYMKENMRVMIVSLVIGLVFLLYMSTKYANVNIALPFSIPILGSSINWIYWYIITSLAISMVIKKVTGDF